MSLVLQVCDTTLGFDFSFYILPEMLTFFLCFLSNSPFIASLSSPYIIICHIEINIYTNLPNAVIFKGCRNYYFRCNIHIFCRERELCVHGSNGYPRCVFLSGNKKEISRKISTPETPLLLY